MTSKNDVQNSVSITDNILVRACKNRVRNSFQVRGWLLGKDTDNHSDVPASVASHAGYFYFLFHSHSFPRKMFMLSVCVSGRELAIKNSSPLKFSQFKPKLVFKRLWESYLDIIYGSFMCNEPEKHFETRDRRWRGLKMSACAVGATLPLELLGCPFWCSYLYPKGWWWWCWWWWMWGGGQRLPWQSQQETSSVSMCEPPQQTLTSEQPQWCTDSVCLSLGE